MYLGIDTMIPAMVVQDFKEMPVFSVIKILIVGLYAT